MSFRLTAILLTADRPEWTREAIGHFAKQTFRDCQLLILDNGEEPLPPWALPLDEPAIAGRVEYHRVPRRTIGELRNIACALSKTDLIACWDSDDYSAPHRLATQVELLDSSGKAVAGYHSMKFTDGIRWWKYICEAGPLFAMGTSLVFRRAWWLRNPFQPVQVGEDQSFSIIAYANEQLISVDAAADTLPQYSAGDAMVARVHANNSDPKKPDRAWMPL